MIYLPLLNAIFAGCCGDIFGVSFICTLTLLVSQCVCWYLMTGSATILCRSHFWMTLGLIIVLGNFFTVTTFHRRFKILVSIIIILLFIIVWILYRIIYKKPEHAEQEPSLNTLPTQATGQILELDNDHAKGRDCLEKSNVLNNDLPEPTTFSRRDDEDEEEAYPEDAALSPFSRAAWGPNPGNTNDIATPHTDIHETKTNSQGQRASDFILPHNQQTPEEEKLLREQQAELNMQESLSSRRPPRTNTEGQPNPDYVPPIEEGDID